MRISFIKIWRAIKKFIPFVYKNERGKYEMFTITPMSCDEFIKRLTPLGFQYNYFSYVDKDQVCNVRRTYISGGGLDIWQYHLRLYRDGEVRGHDEIAYESNAIAHENGATVCRIIINYSDKYQSVLMEDKA